MKAFVVCAVVAISIASRASASVILSDNLSQLTQPGLGLPQPMSTTTWVTSSFATDANFYSLSTVTLALGGCGPVDAALYSNQAGQPGTQLGLLPPTSGFCQTPFDPWLAGFSGNMQQLNPNTTYWIVLRNTSVPSGAGWLFTSSIAGSGVGFQHTWGQTQNSGTTWSTFTVAPMLMRVTADVPEPAAATLVVLALVLVPVLRRRLGAAQQA